MLKQTIYNLVIGTILFTLFNASAEEKKESSYDKIWQHTRLIQTPDSTIFQSLELSGRLQGDAFSFRESDFSNENLKWRRLRLGFKAHLFNQITLHSEMDLNLNETDQNWDTFYYRLTDSYLNWKFSDKNSLKIGKQSAGFTLDGATSSKKLITPERSIVADNLWFPTEYFSGAQWAGHSENFGYKTGLFSASGEAEFGHFESGYFALFSIDWNIGENGTLRLDYVYNNPDHSSDYQVGARNLSHIGALVYKQMYSKKLGLWSDIAIAKGIKDRTNSIDQGDLFGWDITPFYNINEQLQLVLQYSAVLDLENQSTVRMSRYAYKNVTGKKVESTHNLLLGFNWYLYGHKLKWQNAIEYNFGEDLDQSGKNYSGYGLTSAFRMSW